MVVCLHPDLRADHYFPASTVDSRRFGGYRQQGAQQQQHSGPSSLRYRDRTNVQVTSTQSATP